MAFRAVLLALCFNVPVFGAVNLSHDSLPKYTFDQYMKDYHKSYDDAEIVEREKIFHEQVAAIVAHNNRGASWTETVNKFTDETIEERNTRKGIDKSILFKSRSMLTGRKPKPNRPMDVPASVDWREQGVVTSVKDQGFCGSCWAFAATECLESHIAIQTGYLFTLSEQEFVSCVENPDECGGQGGCQGATPELAFQYAQDNGLVTEWTTPYLSYTSKPSEAECTVTQYTPSRVAKIDGYVTLESNNYQDLIEAVAYKGPIAITVDASAWAYYDSGVFDGCNQENPELDHAVLLVGYGTDEDSGLDYWLVRNSWGPEWGEEGYIRLLRSSDEASRCGVDVNPADGTGCAGGPSNVTVCGTCGILYDTSYPTGGRLA